MKLKTRQVEKPWGRNALPPPFGDTGGRTIGEIWFEGETAAPLPLLAKYIFTSDKLSVQVHPDDDQARARGLRGGKSECWYILDAEPGAVLGLGLREAITPERLRTAALDGSIEALMDWVPVSAGDFYFVPAGTVHAIGAGVALLEFQQDNDITYRLYDYGRPRELHLDEAVSVARPGPYRRQPPHRDPILFAGPPFALARLDAGAALPPEMLGRRRWVLPLKGEAGSDGESATSGECLLLEADAPLRLSPDAVALVGVEGALE